jgi:hypothetical protein
MVPPRVCTGLGFLDIDQQHRLNQLQAVGLLWVHSALEEVGLRVLQWQALDHADRDPTALDLLLTLAEDARKHRVLLHAAIQQLDRRGQLGFVPVERVDHFAAGVLAEPVVPVLLLVALWTRAVDGHAAAALREGKTRIDLLDRAFLEVLQLHAREHRVLWTAVALEVRRLAERQDQPMRDHSWTALQRLLVRLDVLLGAQAARNASAFLDGAGRRGRGVYLEAPVRARMQEALQDGYRWAFVGVGMRQPQFRRLVAEVFPSRRDGLPDGLFPSIAPARR